MDPARIKESFAQLQDPRVDRTKRHPLGDIIVIAILAVISGSDGWDDIVDFATVRESWLRTFLELPNGIPCADTFRRVFAALDPREFGRCFARLVAELGGHVEGKLVCIDGKTMRRTFARERGQGALHIVSAWVAENGVTLGQVAVDAKSNEIVAIPELLAMLEIQGATVTIDAAGCQRKIAQAIIEKRANYLLSLKDNQPRERRQGARTARSSSSMDEHRYRVDECTKAVEGAPVPGDGGARTPGRREDLALSLLKNEPTGGNKSVARKRKRAGWDHEYLFKVLAAAAPAASST